MLANLGTEEDHLPALQAGAASPHTENSMPDIDEMGMTPYARVTYGGTCNGTKPLSARSMPVSLVTETLFISESIHVSAGLFFHFSFWLKGFVWRHLSLSICGWFCVSLFKKENACGKF